MNLIQAYKAADGRLYETEIEVAKANVEYWKRQVEWLSRPPESRIPQPGDSDHHYSYDGGHQ
jgi:hypothetical protein